ncbi:MAG TPA: hypothetical protein VFJ79_02515, partial [Acidimicrobiales bacterium]|nr:hypothetical protein [Acidimicrobiales bacterium]
MTNPDIDGAAGLDEFIATVKELETSSAQMLSRAEDIEALVDAKRDSLGKRSKLAGLNSVLGKLSSEQRREAGAVLNQARSRLEELAAARSVELESAERSR